MKRTHKKKAMKKNVRPHGLRQPKNKATSKKLMKALTMEPPKNNYLKKVSSKEPKASTKKPHVNLEKISKTR